ncbi:MAG: ATP-binding protein [Candidatus Cloacimonas sp.]|jgi:light-regulated signal transduction histidine kinase (bacteriophytochrome)|nr:ATP-binding protein [Candidatus Cloacimonas sp.]
MVKNILKVENMHIISDITTITQYEAEIKALKEQLEKEIEERNALLEQANSEMQAFAYSVSHDLRSPLRGIDGWSQALLEDFGAELNETAKGYLDRIRSEAQRMYDLIDALLKLSRISKREVNVESVNLSVIAAALVAKQRELYPQRKVVVNIQPDVIVSGDKIMLETLMDNLMDNAWKFSGQKDVAQIDFGTIITEGDHVCFLQDNGVGFNKSYARNLFGVFQRMHRPADFPGIGIGLAIAQRIILRHGGSIWVESAMNEGATFYWKLRSS